MAASDARSSMMVAEAATQIVLLKLDILLSQRVCAECLPMQARVKHAKAKLAMIQEFIPTQYRTSKTTEWSGRLLQALYHAEEFIDKFYLREARERHEALRMAARPLATLVSKCKLWRELSLLADKMEELCDEKFLKDAESSSSHVCVPWQGKKLARLTSFWDRQAPTNFLCREAQKEEIMKRIKTGSRWIQGISIVGEQGTGKTFLARWVYSQAKYMNWECRAWVRVSASMDKQEFLFEILRQVEKPAREMKDMDIDEMKLMLRRKLAKTKRFLIVLDDVRPSNEPLLRELVMITWFLSQGNIIYTTEDESTAWYMKPFAEEPIRLDKLKDEESWSMLASKLHRGSDGDTHSNEEKNILDMCRGLPLCISLLSGFLSNAGENERAALAKEGSTMTLLDILQFSCHKLPVHLKLCFIYMALFPVAAPIPIRRLVRLWLAEGLLDSHSHDKERERKMRPEDVGETIILELADRNVIDVVSWRADGSPKACQMLTSLYDMIHPIAISTGFLHIHASSKSKDGNDRDPTSQQQQLPAQTRERTKIRWLAEHTNIVTDGRGGSYPNLNLGHVCSFLSFYLRRGMLTKDITTFLRKMTSETDYGFLRVLDLEGVYKPSLEGVLQKLVLLRYLGLRSTVLDSIPSAVADLHHLQTLDIKHTNITRLPSSLWQGRNLRHLHLNWFYIDLKKILKACGDNVNALTQLQTLSGLVIGEVQENAMAAHMNSLTTLTTLKLFLQRSDNDTSGTAGKAVADWISFRLTNLQSLTFGVIQEAQPVEEAQLEKKSMKVDGPTTEAKLPEEATTVAKPAEQATKVDEPMKEAKPAEEATKVVEPTKEAEPAEEDTTVAKRVEQVKPGKEAPKAAKTAKEAKRSQIGPLPELSLAEKHNELLELYLVGKLNKPSWTRILPVSLRVLTLSGSRVEADAMPQLGGLLRLLRTLRLLANSFLRESMRFDKDGFPSLKILMIWKLPNLEKVIIEPGAMLHLKELELRHLERLETVEGINGCEELENISAISPSDALVKQLGGQKREKTNLNVEKATESTDDDEGDR